MKKNNKINPFYIVLIMIIGVLLILFISFKKTKKFQGKIHYQIIDSNFITRNYIRILYDTDIVYEIKKDSTIEKFEQKN